MVGDESVARDLMLAEFTSLRAESAAAKQNQQIIFQWSLAAIGAVWIATIAIDASAVATFVSLGVVIPVISAVAFAAWIGELHRMERVGKFLRARELAFNTHPYLPFSSALAPRSLPIMWESLIFDDLSRPRFSKNTMGSLAAIALFGLAYFASWFGAVLIFDDAATPANGISSAAHDALVVWLWVAPIIFILLFAPPLFRIRAASHGRLPDPTTAELPSGVTVDLVLPCLNESDALPWVASRIPTGTRAILIDNGSTDGSPELAAALGFTVLTSPERDRIGGVIELGIAVGSSPYVCVMDCDGTVDPADLVTLAVPLLAGKKLSIGVPRQRLAGGLPHLGLILARTGILKFKFGSSAPSQLGSARAFSRKFLEEISHRPISSGNAWSLDLTLRVIDLEGAESVETTRLDYLTRLGRSKITGTPRGAWATIADSLRVARTYRWGELGSQRPTDR